MMKTSPWESLNIPNTLIEHKGPGSIERGWWEERIREREKKTKLCFVDRMWEIVGVRGMVIILWVGRIGPEPSLGLRCSHWFPGSVGSQRGRRCGGGKALLNDLACHQARSRRQVCSPSLPQGAHSAPMSPSCCLSFCDFLFKAALMLFITWFQF